MKNMNVKDVKDFALKASRLILPTVAGLLFVTTAASALSYTDFYEVIGVPDGSVLSIESGWIETPSLVIGDAAGGGVLFANGTITSETGTLTFGADTLDVRSKLKNTGKNVDGSDLPVRVHDHLDVSGNLDVAGDVSADNMYSKGQVLDLLTTVESGDADLTNYYDKDEVDILVADAGSDLSGYYTSTQTNSLLGDKLDTTSAFTQTLADARYYTQSAADSQFAATTALSDYYTKTQSDSQYATTSQLATKADSSALSNYYTKTETYSDTEVDSLVAGAGGVESLISTTTGWSPNPASDTYEILYTHDGVGTIYPTKVLIKTTSTSDGYCTVSSNSIGTGPSAYDIASFWSMPSGTSTTSAKLNTLDTSVAITSASTTVGLYWSYMETNCANGSFDVYLYGIEM